MTISRKITGHSYRWPERNSRGNSLQGGGAREKDLKTGVKGGEEKSCYASLCLLIASPQLKNSCVAIWDKIVDLVLKSGKEGEASM